MHVPRIVAEQRAVEAHRGRAGPRVQLQRQLTHQIIVEAIEREAGRAAGSEGGALRVGQEGVVAVDPQRIGARRRRRIGGVGVGGDVRVDLARRIGAVRRIAALDIEMDVVRQVMSRSGRSPARSAGRSADIRCARSRRRPRWRHWPSPSARGVERGERAVVQELHARERPG